MRACVVAVLLHWTTVTAAGKKSPPTPAPTPYPTEPPAINATDKDSVKKGKQDNKQQCGKTDGVHLHTDEVDKKGQPTATFGDSLKCGWDNGKHGGLPPLHNFHLISAKKDWTPKYHCGFTFKGHVGPTSTWYAVGCGGAKAENDIQFFWVCDGKVITTEEAKFSKDSLQEVNFSPPEEECHDQYYVTVVNKNQYCAETLKKTSFVVHCEEEIRPLEEDLKDDNDNNDANKPSKAAMRMIVADSEQTTSTPIVPVAALLVVAAVFFVLLRSGKTPVSEEKTSADYGTV